MTILSTTLRATAVAALMFAAVPFASASGDIDPALKDKVTATLTAQGYDVRKIQMEDGQIEVYAVKDGQTMELYLNDKLEIQKTGGEEGEDSEG